MARTVDLKTEKPEEVEGKSKKTKKQKKANLAASSPPKTTDAKSNGMKKKQKLEHANTIKVENPVVKSENTIKVENTVVKSENSDQVLQKKQKKRKNKKQKNVNDADSSLNDDELENIAKKQKKKKKQKNSSSPDTNDDKLSDTEIKSENVNETDNSVVKSEKNSNASATKQKKNKKRKNLKMANLPIPKSVNGDSKKTENKTLKRKFEPEVTGDDTPKGKKKKTNTKPDDQDDSKRTIFVGNLPLATKRKELRQLFSGYGKVDSVRLRGIAPANPTISKRLAFISKRTHPDRTSIIGYVKFVDESSAVGALVKNGELFKDNHLNVDLASKESNNKGLDNFSVFVGNVAFEAEEEQLHEIFSSCGEIKQVRIIRESSLGSSKGFAFVNYGTKDAVELALQLNGTMFKNRPLRVVRNQKKKRNFTKKPRTAKVKSAPGISKSQLTEGQNKMKLSFMKNEKPNIKTDFSGIKTAEHGKVKKFKNKKMTKPDKKKLDVAFKLTGVKAIAKKSFKSKIKAKKSAYKVKISADK